MFMSDMSKKLGSDPVGLFIWTLSPNGSTRHYFPSTIVTFIFKNGRFYVLASVRQVSKARNSSQMYQENNINQGVFLFRTPQSSQVICSTTGSIMAPSSEAS